MPNYPALVFYIWGDSHHWLPSYCWETTCQSLPELFHATCRQNCALDRKNEL